MDVEETKVSGVSVCLSVCLSYLLPFFFHSLPPILYPSLTFFLSHSLLRGLSLPLFLSLYHSSFPLSSSPLPFPSLTILLFLFSSPLFTLHSLSSFPHRLRSHPSIHSPIQVFVYPRMFSIHDMAEDAGIPSDSAENDGKRGRLLKGVLISCTLPFVFSLLPPPRSLSLSLLLFRLTNPTSFHSPSLPPSSISSRFPQRSNGWTLQHTPPLHSQLDRWETVVRRNVSSWEWWVRTKSFSLFLAIVFVVFLVYVLLGMFWDRFHSWSLLKLMSWS